MKGDIAIAGFYLTAEEWQALDMSSRAMLVAAATRHEAPIVAAQLIALGSEPNIQPPPISEPE